MVEDFGSDFIQVTDEEGNVHDLELLDTLELEDETYYALTEATAMDNGKSEEDQELIILKVIEEDGEELLTTLENEEELEMVFDMFMDRLYDGEADE